MGGSLLKFFSQLEECGGHGNKIEHALASWEVFT